MINKGEEGPELATMSKLQRGECSTVAVIECINIPVADGKDITDVIEAGSFECLSERTGCC